MVTPVTELDASRQEGSHRFPQFLPDGRHFLFTVRSSLADQAGVYAGSLDGKTKKLLIRGNTTALYAPSGHVLFLDGDTLMGQAFDAERLELRGQAFLVEGGVGRSSTGSWFLFSIRHGHAGLRGHTFNTRPADLVRSWRNPVRFGRVLWVTTRISGCPPTQTRLAASVSGSEDRLPRYLDHGPHAGRFSAVHVRAGLECLTGLGARRGTDHLPDNQDRWVD